MRFMTVLFALSVILTITFEESDCATITIPTDFPSIQEGLFNATAGDTVFVMKGTYFERINFQGENIVLLGEARESTVIDGLGLGIVVTFDRNEGNDCVISGFTIRNGAGCMYGGGIQCWDGASPTIENNVITENSCTFWGGGIEINDCSAVIKNNIISNNYAANEGGGIFVNGSYGRISGNSFINNSAGYIGGAIRYRSSSGVIENNLIAYNHTVTGGGYFGGNFGANTISNNTFYANKANSGSAIFVAGDKIDMALWNNIYSDNLDSEAVVTQPGHPQTLYNSLFWNNKEGDYRDAICGEGNIFDCDPRFADVAEDDFHLLWDSPCIDAGDTEHAPEIDFEGDERPQGASSDIGYDEFANGVFVSPGEFSVTMLQDSVLIFLDTLPIISPRGDTLAYTLSKNQPWIHLWPRSGYLYGEDTALSGVLLDGRGLPDSTYYGKIDVTVDGDEYHEDLEIPITMVILDPYQFTVETIPDTTHFQRGDTAGFLVKVTNNTRHNYVLDAWLSLTLPDGKPYEGIPMEIPEQVYLSPYHTYETHVSVLVSEKAPLGGAYVLEVKVGDFPDAIWASDGFEFDIVLE